jgi:hypothetical protein
MDACRREDYEEVLRRAEGLKLSGEETSSYCFHHGSNLGHLGRLDEAEFWLRRPRSVSRRALHSAPNAALANRYMAELRLLRREEPGDALRCAERAVSVEKADTGISPELQKLNLGEHLATLAWATAAASHDATVVTQLAVEAVANVANGIGGVESKARVQYHLGRAFAELGDRHAAT